MEVALTIITEGLSLGVEILTYIHVLGLPILVWEAFFTFLHILIRLLFLKSG